MARQQAKGGLNFKRWFKFHVWSALATFVLIVFLAITGVFIYPLDQFRLRDVHIKSALLPPRYEVNTWGEHVKSIAVTEKGWFATHRQGVFRSLDRGQTWQDVTEDIPGDFVAGEGLYPPVLAANPSDTQMLMVSKGRGIALSMNGGEDWKPYGESYDEDLSTSGIVQLIFAPRGVAVAIDENGFVYQRLMHPDEDEGWELTSFAPPYGEESGVGKLDWMTVALHLHNGQVFLENDWWWVNHTFALLLGVLAYTGVALWWHRRQKRRDAVNAPRPASHWYFRHLHRVGGLVSWPLLYLLPISGILLLHIVDFSVFANHGPPAAWFPEQFDTNRWKGPVYLNLRTLAISRSNPAHMWVGHTYGLFATEDGGQTWAPVGETFSSEVLKHVDHLYVGPGWVNFMHIGNERGLQVSRNFGGQWTHLLEQPIDALYTDRQAMHVVTGNTLLSQRMTSLVALKPPPWEETLLAPPYGPQRSVRATTLYQLLHDAHSGELFGTWFKYVLDVVVILMIVQSVTGLVLWVVPRWRRLRTRHQTRERRFAHATHASN